MNVFSIIIGLIALILALIGFWPLLGWVNWIVVPMVAVGIVSGLLAKKTTGRNINLVVAVLAGVRLMVGGGII